MGVARLHKFSEGVILGATVLLCSFHPRLPLRTRYALVSLLLLCTFVTYFVTLPSTWLTASRTNTGAGSGLQYGLLLLPLGLASLQVYSGSDSIGESRAELGEDAGYKAFMFWCCCACSLLTVLDSTVVGKVIKPLPIRIGFLQALAFGVVALWSGKARLLPEEESEELAFVFYLVYTFGALLCHDMLFFAWRKVFVKSFTVGEAVLAIQSLTLTTIDFAAYAAVTHFQLFPNRQHFPKRPPLHLFLQGGMLGVVWTVVPLCPILYWYAVGENETSTVDPRLRGQKGKKMGKRVPIVDLWSRPIAVTVAFYGILCIWLGLVVAPFLALLADGVHPIEWLFYFSLSSWDHLLIAFYWAVLLGVTLPLIHLYTSEGQVVLIIVRKFYHLLALAMFTPAIIFTPDLLFIASGVALGVFAIVEMIRICRIPPFGVWLNSFLRTYTDKRDEGYLILTHFYLLFGVGSTLWTFHYHQPHCLDDLLLMMSGLVVLGAADAAGAIVGYSYGTHHWWGSRKTMEGTAAAVAASLVTYTLVYACGVLFAGSGSSNENCRNITLDKVALAVAVTCLLEAFTTQIDNLVLPIFLASVLIFTI